MTIKYTFLSILVTSLVLLLAFAYFKTSYIGKPNHLLQSQDITIDDSVTVNGYTYRFYFICPNEGATGSCQEYLNIQKENEKFASDKNIIITYKGGYDIGFYKKSENNFLILYPDSVRYVEKKSSFYGILFDFESKKSNGGFIYSPAVRKIYIK
jgi:hypothetical protein